MDYHKFANQTLDSCESTQEIAKALGKAGVAHGTWVAARTQTKGRGRRGTHWESQEGNLFLSVVLRNITASLGSWVPLCGALAVAQVLQERFPELKIQIKWPNDLWCREKIGGLLAESLPNSSPTLLRLTTTTATTPPVSAFVLGIGLNCATHPLGQTASSLTAKRQGELVLGSELLQPVLQAVLAEYRVLQAPQSADSTTQLRQEYEMKALFTPGTLLSWSNGQFQGRVQGLGPSGELLVWEKLGSSTMHLRALFSESVKAIRITNDEFHS